jgi:hypothetical protein
MPTKLFEETQTHSTSGNSEAFADTKDDAADLAHTSRFLHISTAGNVHVASELVAIRAARDFAESGNVRNPALADRMEKRWARRWPRWSLEWKKQFSAGGALRAYSLRDPLTPN